MPSSDPVKTAALIRNACAGLAVLAAIALVVVWFLSWTFLSHSDKYGRVDIPGQAVLHFPEGEIEVSFRTVTATTNGSGGALNVPPLSLGVRPADGAGPDPEVEEDIGSTTSVNGDAHARVWRLQVAEEGDYRVTAGGQVGGYINPQLTFGSQASVGGTLTLLGIASGALLVAALGAHLVVRRSRREASGPSIDTLA